jgi:hypothetical protein
MTSIFIVKKEIPVPVRRKPELKNFESEAKLGKEKAARRFYLPLWHDSARTLMDVLHGFGRFGKRPKCCEPV